jgi:AbrB family looped-hinge helix DNA binding protein
MTMHVTVTPNGRMSLPAKLRKKLGLSQGGELLAEETADGIILRTVEQAIAQAQARARRFTSGKPEASVEAFLKNRRADSGE